MSRSIAFAQHVTMRLVTSQVLAPTVRARRVAARIFLEVGARHGLLAFRLADTHAHALLLSTREDAGRFARVVQGRLRFGLGLPAPFEPARFTPVESQRHLERTFLYVLRQEQRHGVHLDPRHEASSAPDLVGMRVIAPDLAPRLARALPRLCIEELAPLLQLERAAPAFDRLADAAAAALALPDLHGHSPLASVGRLAAIHAARELTSHELADALRITPRSVQRLRHTDAPIALVRAVRLQLELQPSADLDAHAHWPAQLSP